MFTIKEITSDFLNIATVQVMRGGSLYSGVRDTTVTVRGGQESDELSKQRWVQISPKCCALVPYLFHSLESVKKMRILHESGRFCQSPAASRDGPDPLDRAKLLTEYKAFFKHIQHDGDRLTEIQAVSAETLVCVYVIRAYVALIFGTVGLSTILVDLDEAICIAYCDQTCKFSTVAEVHRIRSSIFEKMGNYVEAREAKREAFRLSEMENDYKKLIRRLKKEF